MKINVKTILICISAFFISIFSSAQKTTIKGVVENGSYYKVIKIDNILAEKKIDSAQINHKGEFKLEPVISKTEFFKLYLDDANYIILILIPGENVEVKMNIKEPFKPEIKGSPNTELIYSTLKYSQEQDKKVEEYKIKMQKEKKEFIKNMINTNSGSLACLFFIEQLDINEDFESYKKLYDGLSKQFKGIPLVDELKKKIDSRAKLSVGSEAPEIDLPNPEGKSIKLSSLRGKIVLIDFWASWCRPCRKESPNMVKLYNKYHSKGFEIYSVSFDEKKEAWIKAIADDKLGAWTHVSDLKYWNCEAGQIYGVEGIPYTVLVDKDGKIIAKELRGDELEKKLDEIFK